MADVSLDGVSKRFGDDAGGRRPDLAIARRRVRRAARADRRRQDDDAAPGRRAGDGRMPARSRSAGATSTALTPAARDVAFVFQQYSLYPHLSVFDNLAFPLRSPARRMPEDEITPRVAGGRRAAAHRRQAAATARRSCPAARCSASPSAARWCASPSIYLMDEPLSSLDAKLRADLRLELKRIQQELGATILYVTHDQIEAMTMADRIGILDRGPAGPDRHAARDLRPSRRTCYVAARLGQPAINLLPRGPAARRRRAGRHDDDRRAHRASAHRARPPTAMPTATVDWIEHLGDQNHLHLTVGERKLVTLADPDTPLADGRRGDDRADARRSSSTRLATGLRDDDGHGDAMTRIDADGADRRPSPTRSSAHADELTALDQAIGDGDHGAQHEARLRGGAGRRRRARGKAAARGAEGDRHASW